MGMTVLMTTGYSSAGPVLGQLSGNAPDTKVNAPEAKAAPVKAAAQDQIDDAERACLNAAGESSETGMLACMATAYEKWDAKLNTAYQGLRKRLLPEASVSLRTAQRAWLKYRDADEYFLLRFFNPKKIASPGEVKLMSMKLEVVRERALTLQNLLSLHEGDPGVRVDNLATPIDVSLVKCRKLASDPAAKAGCSRQASEEWDAEMNEAYGRLRRDLPPKTANALRTAQRAWLVFRDAEYKAIGKIYRGLGKISAPMRAYSELNTVRQRTLILKTYAAPDIGGKAERTSL
jgi:uncharacterized protein YecT (DUF1311 family)